MAHFLCVKSQPRFSEFPAFSDRILYDVCAPSRFLLSPSYAKKVKIGVLFPCHRSKNLAYLLKSGLLVRVFVDIKDALLLKIDFISENNLS